MKSNSDTKSAPDLATQVEAVVQRTKDTIARSRKMRAALDFGGKSFDQMMAGLPASGRERILNVGSEVVQASLKKAAAACSPEAAAKPRKTRSFI
jgi:hypothetical protein